eukprot:2548402-Amphidinium_carterae.1
MQADTLIPIMLALLHCQLKSFSGTLPPVALLVGQWKKGLHVQYGICSTETQELHDLPSERMQRSPGMPSKGGITYSCSENVTYTLNWELRSCEVTDYLKNPGVTVAMYTSPAQGPPKFLDILDYFWHPLSILLYEYCMFASKGKVVFPLVTGRKPNDHNDQMKAELAEVTELVGSSMRYTSMVACVMHIVADRELPFATHRMIQALLTYTSVGATSQTAESVDEEIRIHI